MTPAKYAILILGLVLIVLLFLTPRCRKVDDPMKVKIDSLNAVIAERDSLIGALRLERDGLGQRIADTERELAAKETTLIRLKQKYNEKIRAVDGYTVNDITLYFERRYGSTPR